MPEKDGSVGRRDFLRRTSAAGLSIGMAKSVLAAGGAKMSGGRVVGSNDRINVGVIGVGGRGSYVASMFQKVGEKNNSCQIVAVCDVYEKRKRESAAKFQCEGYLDYR